MACIKKRSRPWLTDNIVQLVAAKRRVEGTPDYDDAVRKCSAEIIAEYYEYAIKARQRPLDVRRGSKLWWTLRRKMLWPHAKLQRIPA